MNTQQEFEAMYPTTEDKVGVIAQAVFGLALFSRMAWSAHKGRYDQATFRALLWGTYSRNVNRAFEAKKKEYALNSKKLYKHSGSKPVPMPSYDGNGLRTN